MTEEQRESVVVGPASPEARQRLTHVLIGKSIVEALFITALAVFFTYKAFHPYFRGSVDVADARTVAGWVVDDAAPGARVEVQLYLNDHFVARRTAEARRPDVLAAGRAADEFHGFAFELPALPRGSYEARVYAAHASDGGRRRTLQLVGQPVRFVVERGPEEPARPGVWWQEE
ncbi:MAG: hypothetical protein ACRD9R_16765 [Pyrinomonadaceae bacterium]